MSLLDQIVRRLDNLLQVRRVERPEAELQVSGREEVRVIGTALNTSFEVIDHAANAGIDLLLVHHGLFENIDPL